MEIFDKSPESKIIVTVPCIHLLQPCEEIIFRSNIAPFIDAFTMESKNKIEFLLKNYPELKFSSQEIRKNSKEILRQCKVEIQRDHKAISPLYSKLSAKNYEQLLKKQVAPGEMVSIEEVILRFLENGGIEWFYRQQQELIKKYSEYQRIPRPEDELEYSKSELKRTKYFLTRIKKDIRYYDIIRSLLTRINDENSELKIPPNESFYPNTNSNRNREKAISENLEIRYPYKS